MTETVPATMFVGPLINPRMESARSLKFSLPAPFLENSRTSLITAISALPDDATVAASYADEYL